MTSLSLRILARVSCSLPILLIPYFLSAQTAPFDIADYARPDLERRTLSLSTTTGFQNDLSKLDSTAKLIESQYFLNGAIHNTKFQNSEKYQKYSGHQARIDFDFGKNDANYAPELDPYTYPLQPWELGQAFDFTVDYNHYFRHKQFGKQQRFFEVDYEVDFYGNYNHRRDTLGTIFFKERATNLTLALAPYIGKGRIEYINDAWHAKTILEMLAEKGLLQTEVSTEQMQAFAETISSVKNIRNTDHRLEQISEYEQLCNFLVIQKLIDPEAYGFYAVLADAWRYESFTTRNSGKELKFGINPRINFMDYKILDEDTAPMLNAAFPAVFAYNIYKPISDDWQFNTTNRLEFGPELDTDYDALTDANKYVYTFRGLLASSWHIGYLPSQRTNCGLSLDLTYYYNRQLTSEYSYYPLEIDRYLGDFNIIWSGYFQYYVSPRFTFTINTRLDFFRNQTEVDAWSSLGELRFRSSYRLY